MEEIKAGMLAWSRAGHDNGQLYVIIKAEREYVWLCEGRLRPLENPKKKNKKHIQVIGQIPDELKSFTEKRVGNEDIKYVIRRFTNV